jgi:dihydrofolate reductase
MRKLKLEMQVSADGFAADSDGGTGWMVWNWAPEWAWDQRLREYHNALTTSSDCILLSSAMAQEGFIQHWEQVAGDPASPQHAFAEPVTRMRKVVFSRKLREASWPRTELARGGLAETVEALKREPGKDLLAYGGPTFASSLLAAGLVDELHIFQNPSFLGAGRPMFKDLRQAVPMRLKGALPFECGVVVLQYVPVRH